MKNIKKITISFIFLFSLFCLGGCSLVAKPAPTSTTQTQNIATKSGQLIIKTAEGYLLKSGTEVVTITSQKYNLDSYIKKYIEVSGMYSGKVLYVDKLKEVK
jgi:hypothetical protein